MTDTAGPQQGSGTPPHGSANAPPPPEDAGRWAAGGPLVVAVDGPAGAGKSSAARGAAIALGLRYLDTGAMYRTLGWWMLARGIDVADADAVTGRIREPVIEAGTDPASPAITVDGTDVAGLIRSAEVSAAASAVASLPAVRSYLIGRQQQIIAAARDGIVAEGRDIGTVVAPHAPVKVFLTASAEARALRRSADLVADPAAIVEQVRREQSRRDRKDAPQLARAADAIEIDTTARTLDEVIGLIVGLAREVRPQRAAGPAASRGAAWAS